MKRAAPLFIALMLASCADRTATGPEPSTAGTSLAVSRAAPSFTFTAIEFPNARSTTALGINAGGDVVGVYVDQSQLTHGFLLRNAVFATIDYPKAVFTDARGIGQGGEIVGRYRLAGEAAIVSHGFRLSRQGEFSAIEFNKDNKEYNTIPQRVLPDGTVLGCRHDTDLMSTMRGILVGARTSEEITAFASMHNGASPDLSRIVGLYTDMMDGQPKGYVIEDGDFTPLVFDDGTNTTTQTAAWDVNPAGEIVGNHRDASGFHGFILIDGEYTAIDVPITGATLTRTFGMNARGDVVGSFSLNGKTMGYVARRER
jgi:hypothetical protein